MTNAANDPLHDLRKMLEDAVEQSSFEMHEYFDDGEECYSAIDLDKLAATVADYFAAHPHSEEKARIRKEFANDLATYLGVHLDVKNTLQAKVTDLETKLAAASPTTAPLTVSNDRIAELEKENADLIASYPDGCRVSAGWAADIVSSAQDDITARTPFWEWDAQTRVDFAERLNDGFCEVYLGDNPRDRSAQPSSAPAAPSDRGVK